MDYVALLKPPPFTVGKVGDPEQLLHDFKEYIKIFKKLVLVTGVGGDHTGDHTNCGACQKTKATLEWVGGKEMGVLFGHTGKVTEVDTFAQAVEKMEEGIKAMAKVEQGIKRLTN